MYAQADLFKMHTYRDGILGSRGAYVLFPGAGSGDPEVDLFVRHPSEFGSGSVDAVPSVGAFSLTPGGGNDELKAIGDFIGEIFEKLLDGGAYVEESGYFPT